MSTASNFADVQMIMNQKPEGNRSMLLHEELARIRMREAQRSAEQHRVARRLSATRRWRRVAGWATKRAEKASSLL